MGDEPVKLQNETFIRVFNDVIPHELCDELIKKFEENTDQFDKVEQSSADFTQIDFSQDEMWREERNKLYTILQKQIQEYKMQVGVTEQMWPKRYTFEGMRMKRYMPDGKEEFRPHVDVTGPENMKRFLVFFLYLDDNDEGATTFPLLKKGSPCRKGSMLVFPPMWPWLHAGTKPVDKPKYIIGSYLHYDDSFTKYVPAEAPKTESEWKNDY